ncbi:MAG: NosD domain-containing protein [Thermoleophilia bacterium]|nr:NosD domain-containing protein [Thermoleophilia bacterium]
MACYVANHGRQDRTVVKSFAVFGAAIVVLGLLFTLVFQGEALAQTAPILSISDNATGGDCPVIGTWNPTAKTCTLTSDPNFRILIISDNITLDGNGHSITGNGEDLENDAITVTGRTGVTVKNFILRNFNYGVHLVSSHGNTVTNNVSNDNKAAGISLSHSTGNTITGNTISNETADTGICIGYASSSNHLSANTITDADRGIYLHDLSDGNNIMGNTFSRNLNALTLYDSDSNNSITGNVFTGNTMAIYLHRSSNSNILRGNTISDNSYGLYMSDGASFNQVYQNAFINNAIFQVSVNGGSGNSFSVAEPDGGNYWSSYDSAAEGCADVDADGYCDSAYGANGVIDSLAWVRNGGWTCTSPLLSLSRPVPFWATYADYMQHRLSISWTVNNDGNNTVYDVTVSGCMNTNGVMVETPLPSSLGNLAGGNSTSLTLAYSVPMGVGTFRSAIFLTANDRCEGAYEYPAPLPTA